ncbi:MAG: CD1247 N-terminal domain-containing protein [Candidatus Fimivivens sp.]
MTVTERVAYLKGLTEGLDLDTSSKEGKLLNAIIDVLDDIAFEVSDLQEVVGELGEQIDMIDEDLDGLEEIVYDDEEYDDDCCCQDGDLYEIVCPSCGDSIYLDEDMVEEGEMDCPNCSEHLEFDFDEEEDEAEGDE